MAPHADTAAAMPKREVVPCRSKLPPAALSLARLICEAVGEQIWREALAATGQPVAEDGAQTSDTESTAVSRGQRGDGRWHAGE